MEEPWLTEDWAALKSLPPAGWEAKARELGTLKRGRKIRMGGTGFQPVVSGVPPGTGGTGEW